MKQKTGRKLLNFLLALAMLVGLMPGMSMTAYAAGDGTENSPIAISSWDDLKNAMSSSAQNNENENNPTYYIITEDITSPADEYYCIQVVSGRHVVLNLNGKTIDRNRSSSDRMGEVILVQGNLTITDNSDTKTGKITGGNFFGGGGGINVASGGTVTMNGGTISGNSAGTSGGGVFVADGGKFFMNGGTISGNSATKDGGGVYVYSFDTMQGTFTMLGGSITDNSATQNGGGVYVDGGKFNISGNPIIKDNTQGNASSIVTSNVYLPDGNKINVVNALTNDAKIGVTMQTSGVFTSSTESVKASDYKANFTIDNSDFILQKDGNELKLGSHEHIFSYSVNGTTITATCTADGCTLLPSSEGGTDHVATLTIVKPTLETYGETGKSAAATLNGLDAFKAATSLNVAETDIKYVGRDGTTYPESATAPTSGGKYTAKITLSSVKTGADSTSDVTASVDYEIGWPEIYVAGNGADDTTNAWVHGQNWNPGNAADKMTCDNGVYTISYKKVPSGNYEFKFAVNRTWDKSYGKESTTTFQLGQWNVVDEYSGENTNIAFELTGLTDIDIAFNLIEMKAKVDIAPSHTHSFTYNASGATITATCTATATDCPLPPSTEGGSDHVATLTIGAPTLTYVGQTGDGISAVATLTDLNNIQGGATVRYYKANADGTAKDGQELGSAPTDAGKYWAEITLTNADNSSSATAHVVYSIKYAVTFNTNGGSAIPQQLVEAGESATRPTDPTREGNIFGGWFADADFAKRYVFDEVTENTTVYAKWGEHRVTWTVGRFSIQDVFTGNAPAADSNTTVNLAAETLKPDGATLSWKTETDVSGDVTHTAQFSFPVTLNVNGGTINAGNVESYIYGTVATLPTDVTREGYAFGGWYDNSGLTGTAVTQISAADTGNKEYWAKWNQAVSYTVTFKVVNGKWDDDSTADKTVTLTGYEGDTLKLTADQIPAVGSKPNDTYKAGSWDVTPSANTEITAATTYTFTYVAKEAAVVTKAPEAKTLTYNGSAQELVTAGEATGGEMQYALGTATEATQPYTTSIPTATDAGTYYVWYKVVGDDNHLDSAAACVTVTIDSVDSESGIPEEGALVFNGSAQELVKGGSAVGGTLKYALGSNAAQAPQDGWSEDVPEGTDAGTYYVWYRVDGDANHNGTAPACVTVTILKAPAPGTVEEKQKASALAPVYNGKTQALVRAPGSLPAGYEKAQYSTDEGRTWSDALPKGTKAGSYSVLVKYVGDKNHTAFTYGPLSATIAKAKITITAQNKKTTRGKALAKLTYKVSGADASGDRLGIKLSTTAKKTAKAGKYPISVSWNKNSNYSATIKKGTYTLADAILSTEKKAAKIRMNAGLNVDWDGSGVLVKWGDTPDAESYEVWAAYCGKNSPAKKIGTLGAGENSFRFTSLGKKELNPKKAIKVTVLAYRKVNGKKTKIANTITAHVVSDTNPVYSNAAKITLTRTKYSLKAGKKARIKAGEILADKKKKSLGKGHALTFRYASSRDSVATVDKNGTITAVGRGTCTVYVYARNGRARRISVTVK